MNKIRNFAMLFVLAAASLFAQMNTLSETTLSAAVSATDQVINVASATGISAGKMLFVITAGQPKGEAMLVRSTSSTRITVFRGREGTFVVPHLSGAQVFAGDPDWFYSRDPYGKCVLADQYARPWVNINNAAIWDCTGAAATSAWTMRQPVDGTAMQHYRTYTVATDSTAGNITMTVAQTLKAGLLLRNTNGASRTDTLPTATLIKEAIPGVRVGSAFEFTIRNTAGAAETITVAAGTGGTMTGTATIAQNNSKRFLLVMTAVGATPTYDVHSLGTVVH